MKADRELVLAVVALDGRALMYASVELQADRDVVPIAVSRTEVPWRCSG